MEVLTIAVAAVTPVLVTSVTGAVKKIGTLPTSSHRVLWIRALVAILAVIGAGLTQVIGGDAVDGGLVETAILALVNAGVATWVYFRK